MNVFLTITNAEVDQTGPFDIYSDVTNFNSAFESNISLAQLEAGFATDNVPDGTTEIKVKSNNKICSISKTISIP